MKTIRFKSDQKFWEKEYLGLKPNTIRKFLPGEEDMRQEILLDFILGQLNILNIEMENTFTGEVFKRRVVDVSKFEENFIISWSHQYE